MRLLQARASILKVEAGHDGRKLSDEVHMKIGRVPGTVLTLTLFAVGSVIAQEQPASRSKPVTPAATALIATAPALDHLSLAQYFREIAVQEQTLAKSYDRIARTYREKAIPAGL